MSKPRCAGCMRELPKGRESFCTHCGTPCGVLGKSLFPKVEPDADPWADVFASVITGPVRKGA